MAIEINWHEPTETEDGHPAKWFVLLHNDPESRPLMLCDVGGKTIYVDFETGEGFQGDPSVRNVIPDYVI